jgi:hypothetical protein
MSGEPLHGRTILVIDDAEYRDTVRRLLESLGARVLLAADGFEGLAQLERWTPDAVLCDLSMPGMGGIEFAQRMRPTPRNRRVLLVAVTGRPDWAAVLDTWAAGFDAHIVKPVTLDQLSAIGRRVSATGVAEPSRGA